MERRIGNDDRLRNGMSTRQAQGKDAAKVKRMRRSQSPEGGGGSSICAGYLECLRYSYGMGKVSIVAIEKREGYNIDRKKVGTPAIGLC